MNQEAINNDLAERIDSPMQTALLKRVKGYIRASANKMFDMHAEWDNNSYVYRGYRVYDRKDRDSNIRGEPAKILVPITYAQTQTALSFVLSTFQQKKNIFELQGSGPEDVQNADAMELDLSYQTRQNKYILKLYFQLLDSLKYGFGVVRTDWETRKVPMRVQKSVIDTSFMATFGSVFGRKPSSKMVESVEEVLAYEGNKITNISPYAFYPDPAFNLADFQNGSFVGHEEDSSFTSVFSLEGSVYFGTDKIPKTMSKDLFESRPRRARGPFGDKDGYKDQTFQTKDADSCVVTYMQFSAIPAKLSKELQIHCGDESVPRKFVCTGVNDQKIVQFERLSNLHGQFTYSLFEYSPDSGAFYNPGLAETIGELQSTISFFLNSHIVNVKSVIANRFIVDPSKIEMSDLETGKPYIRTKGAVADFKRAIEQLQLSDITRGHVADVGTLTQLISVVSGISDNALGQYSSGRRSATEARNVNAGSASRLKMFATNAWLQGIEPNGAQLIANTRQWRSREFYNAILGDKALTMPFERVILADPSRIAGGYDFASYDATLPSDKQFQAGILTELFTTLINKPEAMQLLNKNPLPLMEYILQLYDIRNIKDFDLTSIQQPLAPTVVPDAQVGEALAQGQAEPVDLEGQNVLAQLAGK